MMLLPVMMVVMMTMMMMIKMGILLFCCAARYTSSYCHSKLGHTHYKLTVTVRKEERSVERAKRVGGTPVPLCHYLLNLKYKKGRR